MTEKGGRSEFLIVLGEKAETTHSLYIVPTPIEYWLLTTYPRERWYRQWWLMTHRDLGPVEQYASLSEKYPHGLSHLPELPEERSGEVGRLGLAHLANVTQERPLDQSPVSLTAATGFPKGAAV